MSTQQEYNGVLAVQIWQNNVHLTGLDSNIELTYQGEPNLTLLDQIPACGDHEPYELKAVPSGDQNTGQDGYGTVVKQFRVPIDSPPPDFDKIININFIEGIETVTLTVNKFVGTNETDEYIPMPHGEISFVKVGGIEATETGTAADGQYTIPWIPLGQHKVVVVPADTATYPITRQNISLSAGDTTTVCNVYPAVDLRVFFKEEQGDDAAIEAPDGLINYSGEIKEVDYYISEERGDDTRRFWTRLTNTMFHETRTHIGGGRLKVVVKSQREGELERINVEFLNLSYDINELGGDTGAVQSQSKNIIIPFASVILN